MTLIDGSALTATATPLAAVRTQLRAAVDVLGYEESVYRLFIIEGVVVV